LSPGKKMAKCEARLAGANDPERSALGDNFSFSERA